MILKKIKARLYCLFHEHDWDRVHGYDNLPVSGAKCERQYCGKQL